MFVNSVSGGEWKAGQYHEIGPPIPSVDECREIAAAKRKDGWSADGKVLDPFFGDDPAEVKARQERCRREIEGPKASGWRFTTLLGTSVGCYAFNDNGKAWFIGVSSVIEHDDSPQTIKDAVAGTDRVEITAAEAWARLGPSVQSKFIELTGYQP